MAGDEDWSWRPISRPPPTLTPEYLSFRARREMKDSRTLRTLYPFRPEGILHPPEWAIYRPEGGSKGWSCGVCKAKKNPYTYMGETALDLIVHLDSAKHRKRCMNNEYELGLPTQFYSQWWVYFPSRAEAQESFDTALEKAYGGEMEIMEEVHGCSFLPPSPQEMEKGLSRRREERGEVERRKEEKTQVHAGAEKAEEESVVRIERKVTQGSARKWSWKQEEKETKEDVPPAPAYHGEEDWWSWQ